MVSFSQYVLKQIAFWTDHWDVMESIRLKKLEEFEVQIIRTT